MFKNVIGIATLLLAFVFACDTATAQDVSITLNNGVLTINGTSRGDDVEVSAGRVAPSWGHFPRVTVNIDDRRYLNYRIERVCLLYTSPSPRDGLLSRMPSSA